MPTNYPDCPKSLIKVEVNGQDADLFRDKVTEIGALTVSGLSPGSYSFSIEASMGKELIELNFSVFVRDPDFKIPLDP